MGIMKREGPLTCVIVRVLPHLAVLVIALAASSSCSQATGSEGLLRLNAVYLSEHMEYIASKLSEEAGTFGLSARPVGSDDADTVLLKLAVRGDSTKTLFSLPTPGGRTTIGQGIPLVVLADNRVLLRCSDWNKKVADFRERVQYSVLDAETSEEQDITPRNLDDTTPWLCKAGPPFVWSDEQGFLFLIPEDSRRTVHVWQGKKVLRETESRDGILGIGKAYIGDRLTAVLVTADGYAYSYDYESGRFVESAPFADISQSFSNTATDIEIWPFTFVMSRGLVAYRHKVGSDNVIRIVDLEGHVQDFVKRSVIQRKPDGSLRDPSDVEAVSSGKMLLYSEGRLLSLELISTRTSPIPLDETRLGLLDVLYGRLITIEPNHD